MSSTTMQQQRSKKIGETLNRVEQINTPGEALATLTISPSVMAYEARYALQQLREAETGGAFDPTQVIEPLARAVGWAEGLAFALAFANTDPNVISQLGANGQSKR